MLLGPGALVALLLSGGLGCGARPAESPDARVRRDTRIVHEPCDVDGGNAQPVDVDADGRADLTRVLVSGRETCRALDFNFDGKIDRFVYRAADGSIRRRESDFDRDGRIDEIVTYERGIPTSKQHATNLAGKLDTWHYFQTGVLSKSERDSNGDAVIDQWWEYPRLPASECAVVHSDVDGDGRPDPGATVDLCEQEEGQAAAPAPSGGAP